jgi:hypothetical protein
MFKGLNALTHIDLSSQEKLRAQHREVLIEVIVWHIAAVECAAHKAVGAGEPRQCLGCFALLEELVKTCIETPSDQ